MDNRFQHDHASDGALDEIDREVTLTEIAPRRLSDEERLRAEVRAVFFSFALAGVAIAILAQYVGSYFVAAIAALITVIGLLPIFDGCLRR